LQCPQNEPPNSRKLSVRKYVLILIQARNQLRTPQEGRRVFREGPKFFGLCPKFLNYVQHIFPGGVKNFLGAKPLLRPPGCGPVLISGHNINNNNNNFIRDSWSVLQPQSYNTKAQKVILKEFCHRHTRPKCLL